MWGMDIAEALERPQPPTIPPAGFPLHLGEAYYKVWTVDAPTYNTFAFIGEEFRGGVVVDGLCDSGERNQLLIVTYHE